MDGGDSASCQTQARQGINVGHEASDIDAGDEGFDCFRMRREKGFAHFRPHFERPGTDGRTQPDEDFRGRHVKPVDGSFQHTRGQSTPTGMGCGHAGTGTVTKQ